MGIVRRDAAKNPRVILLDETGDVTVRAHTTLVPLGIRLTLVSATADLPHAVAGATADDVLIVTLSAGMSSWEVVQHVRRGRFEGRVLLLVDDAEDPRIDYVRYLGRAQWTVRPPTAAALDALLKKTATEAGDRRAAIAPDAPTSYRGIVGASRAMLDIFSRIEKVATGDPNVCIVGESGTGKELIARAIHEASPRADRPHVVLDCTAIPEGLMESHLFGHVKGAFTGAVEHRGGLFSLAHTGTLFLDELCELSLPLQAKLLRVIQNREFTKVGGSRPIRTDIRLISATNKDPRAAVAAGAFREDLYYRIGVILIRLPALRERREDIPLLVDHFVQRFAELHKKPIRDVSRTAMDRLMELPWPGNVRQLQNVIEQAVVLAEGSALRERDLFVEESPAPRLSSLNLEPGLTLREVERRYILSTLRKVDGNRTGAARLLGISVRCLQYKLKEYASDEPIDETMPAEHEPAARADLRLDASTTS